MKNSTRKILWILLIVFSNTTLINPKIENTNEPEKKQNNHKQFATAKEIPQILKKNCLSVSERKKLHEYYSGYYEEKSSKNMIYLFTGIILYFAIITGYLIYSLPKKNNNEQKKT